MYHLTQGLEMELKNVFPRPDSFLNEACQYAVPLADFLDAQGVRPASMGLTGVLLGLRYAQNLCHGLAKHSGWWDDTDPQSPLVFATKLALCHSEISEALEGGRKGLNDAHLPERKAEEVELADAVIRIFDLAGARGLDLATTIVEKLTYNQQRADHKREHRANQGGKKF